MFLLLAACRVPEPIEPTELAAHPDSTLAGVGPEVDTGTRVSTSAATADITDPCLSGEDGEFRDCGWTYRGVTSCLAGSALFYDFGPAPELEEQVLRICRRTETEPIPCDFLDAVAQDVGRNVRIPRCPRIVDSPTGAGGISVYTAERFTSAR